jgi:hypothetical protein
MFVDEREFDVPFTPGCDQLRQYFATQIALRLDPTEIPVRFAVTRTDSNSYHCEVGVLCGAEPARMASPRSIFDLQHRSGENPDTFNVVLIVPTGIGAEIGGHAGDAGPITRLFGTVCDHLITHPNVVNASDINELPENGLYVEGSVICRLLQGTAGLRRVRSNRVLFVADEHDDESFTEAAINALNAARATYGLDCARIIRLHPEVRLTARYTSTGRAVGRVENLEHLLDALEPHRGQFDALALASVIEVPEAWHEQYFASKGEMVNPWGGVEAIYTHAVSMFYDIPSAHSPMLEDEWILELDSGIVDPRMAAEDISLTFLQCIFKGLQRSPRIVTGEEMRSAGVLTAAEVAALVIPEGCLGLPVLAALEQHIPVIAVRENQNLMRNDLSLLPWAAGQYTVVDNYLEAAGVLCALKSGIAASSVRRPLPETQIDMLWTEENNNENALMTSDGESVTGSEAVLLAATVNGTSTSRNGTGDEIRPAGTAFATAPVTGNGKASKASKAGKSGKGDGKRDKGQGRG